MKNRKNLFMLKIYSLLGILIMSYGAKAQISISVFGNPYTEDFNTLAASGTSSSVPVGWAFLETGTNANTTYTAGTGSSNIGETYSFGTVANTERAFGGIQSGTLIPIIGVNYINNTGSTIIALSISYTGEQWRLGATGRNDRLDLQYSTNASSLTTGTWIDVDPLDFIAPNSTGTVGALDGNVPSNRTSISASITGLAILNGATFWLRWLDFNAAGSDDGLGIDDFSIIAPPNTPTPVVLLSFAGQKEGSHNILRWTTLNEINNLGFEVQRSTDGIYYSVIGFVNSRAPGGNSSNDIGYSLVDYIPPGNKQYYRLRQVDIDHSGKFSSVILIKGEKKAQLSIDAVFPNPANSLVNVLIAAPSRTKLTILVSDISGRMVVKQLASVETGNNTVPLDVSKLAPGNYFVRLICNGDWESLGRRFTKQ